MTEQSAGRLSGPETLAALADMSRLLMTCETVNEGMSNLLALLCDMFDAEGGLFWLVDDSRQMLKRRQSYHTRAPRSKAFEQEVLEQTAGFGKGIAGKVWADGEPRLLKWPPMFAQTPQPSTAREQSSEVNCLVFPLFGGGTICGVMELIGSSIVRLSDEDTVFLNVVAAQVGAFVSCHDTLEQLRAREGQVEHAIRKSKEMEEDLREAKARLARQHDEAVRNALSQANFLTTVSRELRTPLSGIVSIAELLKRTALDSQQQEYTAIVLQSAARLQAVMEDMIEANKESTQQFAAQQRAEAAGETSATKNRSLSDARLLIVNGLVGSTEFIDAYATGSGIKCQSVSRGSSGLTAMRQALAAGRPFDIVFVGRVLPDMDALDFVEVARHERLLANTNLVLVSTFGAAAADDAAIQAGFKAHIAKPIKQAQVISAVQALLEGTSVVAAVETPQIIPMPATIAGKHVILVAEDNPVNQKVALLQLRELGFYAEVVTNGDEAVAAAKQGVFDAILMDCQMPGKDGFEATKEIRNWEQQSGTHITIIAMTAQALASDRDKCLAAGMDDYMSKPVTYDKLDSVLSKWLPVETSSKIEEETMDKPTQSDLDFSPELGRQAHAPAPVDVSVLEEMLGAEEANEILKLFVTSSEELIDKIHLALDRHDVSLLKEAAHTLKGACSSIGANEMWQNCIELEKAAKASDWNKIPQNFAVLEQTFRQAKTFIRSL